MIESFQNKALKNFYEKGIRSGVNQGHVPRIRRILTQLEAASDIHDLAEPSFGMHALQGRLKGF